MQTEIVNEINFHLIDLTVPRIVSIATPIGRSLN